MPSLRIAPAVLLGVMPCGLLAQTSQTGPASPPSVSGKTMSALSTIQAPVGSSQACPVGVTVRRTPGSVLRNAAPQNGKAPALEYRFSLTPSKPRIITSAHVVLHGYNGVHLQLLNGATSSTSARTAPGNARSTEDLTLTPDRQQGHQLFQSVAYVRRLTSVEWVDLQEVSYADGTSWRSPAEGRCRVEPNGFLPVAAESK